MTAGGFRPGAGRKPKLTALERIRAGQRCEELTAQIVGKHTQKAIETATFHSSDEYDALPKFTSRSEREAWLKSDEFKQYQENLKLAISLDQGDDISEKEASELNPTRGIHAPVKRIYAHRRDILEQVAEEFSVSKHTIDKAWKEYRRIISV